MHSIARHIINDMPMDPMAMPRGPSFFAWPIRFSSMQRAYGSHGDA